MMPRPLVTWLALAAACQPPASVRKNSVLSISAAAAPPARASAAETPAAGRNSVERLRELKQWFHSGLIAEEVWVEQQRAILAAAATPSPASGGSASAPPPSTATGSIDVRTFGATGDGATDDTKAIKAAIAAVNAASRFLNCGPGEPSPDQRPPLPPVRGDEGCTTVGPELLFPGGVYRITGTLTPASSMRGVGGVLINQTNWTADIFSSPQASRLYVSGLALHGGANHFNIGTNDMDCAFFVFTQCRFTNASVAAIRLRPPSDYPSRQPPYRGSSSTQVTVRDCVFHSNEQVTIFYGDTITIEDSWVEGCGWNRSAFKGLFENHGVMQLNRVLGVPNVKRGYGQRWIDNYGQIDAKNCRFGGETGGMTIVHTFNSWLCWPAGVWMPSGSMSPPPNSGPLPGGRWPSNASFGCGGSVRIEDSMIQTNAMGTSTNDENCAFFFAQIPEFFSISGSIGFQECPWQQYGCEPPGYSLIKVNSSIDLGPTGQLAVAARWPNAIRLDIAPLESWLDSRPDLGSEIRVGYTALPPELQPFQVNPLHMSAPPTRGTWRVGQKVWARPNPLPNHSGWAPLEGGVAGWVCVESGTPGVWHGIKLQA